MENIHNLGSKNMTTSNPCSCIGPQNGEPLCPCAMLARKVYKKNGHWIQPEVDLGEIIGGDNG